MIDDFDPDVDLDPQEAIEEGHNPDTDISSAEELELPLDPKDDDYTPELMGAVEAFDGDGWPGDELVIADHDDIDDEEEEID